VATASPQVDGNKLELASDYTVYSGGLRPKPSSLIS
jgi:hypothetical protein